MANLVVEWQCHAKRAHGPCNVWNAGQEETCRACGSDRPALARGLPPFDRAALENQLAANRPGYILLGHDEARAALAHINALTAERDGLKEGGDALCAALTKTRMERDKLTARLTALEAANEDTRRLDWLENNPGGVEPASAVHPGWNMDGEHDEEDGWAIPETRWFPTIREAIDAARTGVSDV